jgi:hypothetical protein
MSVAERVKAAFGGGSGKGESTRESLQGTSDFEEQWRPFTKIPQPNAFVKLANPQPNQQTRPNMRWD